MSGSERLLDVRNLRTSFFTQDGEVKAVDDVSFHVDRGEIIAIVGESGCGKSVTQLSLMQLVQSPPGRIVGGSVVFDGENLLKRAPASREMREIRGAGMSIIFQEPLTSLNPVLTIGKQLSEVIRVHARISRKAAWQRGIEALDAVGIPEPAARMKNYPFEMSGGMRQRVMIATAVACNSKLIIADEPTTALDVTTQAQVMELLLELVRKHGKSLIIITHNLGLVSRYAQRVYVMYAGKIIESGSTERILTAPQHPYTVGLLNSMPKLEGDSNSDLAAIQGAPPSLVRLPDICTFLPRCRSAQEECGRKPFPAMRRVDASEHYAACHLRGLEGFAAPEAPDRAALQ